MAFKFEKRMARIAILNKNIDNLLGRKTQFEITLKAIEALFDFANGVKQAANIQNASLSQKAKDGLQYLQDIGQLIQDIKELKRLTDIDLDAIDAAPEDVVIPENAPPFIPHDENTIPVGEP